MDGTSRRTRRGRVQPSNIRIRFDQDNRRSKLLELQKVIREENVEKRKLVDKDPKKKHHTRWMEWCAKTIKRKYVFKNISYEMVTSLMQSEFMKVVPEDINEWIAVLCPVGKRCTVVVQNNHTEALDNATVINCFQSLFPQTIPKNYPSKRKRTVLDCIFSNKLKKYYILDIIEWMGVPYTDFEAKYRFQYMTWKIGKIKDIGERSEKNWYPFEIAQRVYVNKLFPLLLEKSKFFPKNAKLDGINFYHPNGLYTPGCTPLVLWLNPFMIPDVLKKPVHAELALKPRNFRTIENYITDVNRVRLLSQLNRNRIFEGEKVLEDLGETKSDEDTDID